MASLAITVRDKYFDSLFYSNKSRVRQEAGVFEAI